MAPTNTYIAAEGDVIVLMLGQSGSGKSTFINAALGKDVASVGHDLKSHTADIQAFTITHPKNPNRRVVFVDTPGFNDTWETDRDILSRIVQWLTNSAKPNTEFAGIIYLHEISLARNEPTPGLMTPTKLRHPAAAKHLVLTTVKWNEVKADVGTQRERQLISGWKDMLDHGSNTARFLNTRESAWETAELILNTPPADVGKIHQELTGILAQLPLKRSVMSEGFGFFTFLFGRRRK